MRIAERLLGLSPYIEIGLRHIYWNSKLLVTAFQKKRPRRPKNGQHAKVEFSEITAFLKLHGVAEGSLLLVHSSTTSLATTKMCESEMLEALLDLVGNSGTLAMPSNPAFKGRPKGFEYMHGDVSELRLTFDVQKTPPSTGLLPYLLMKHPLAVRSRHPLNTMVAIGPLAEPMMNHNLDGDLPLPCGNNSSWFFCLENSAKIVGLGVDIANALTMIHVSEDANTENWPIENWYRERVFTLLDGGQCSTITVKERRPCWAMNYASRTLAKDLRKAGVLVGASIGGISVDILDSRALIAFLNERRHTGYPYFFFPGGKVRR